MRRQPDDRIHPENLGMMVFNGKRFVVNLRPGVPFNACIEEFDGFLRCWASRHPLDDHAMVVVRKNATPTPQGAFIWNDNVKRGPVACVKGNRSLFRVEF